MTGMTRRAFTALLGAGALPAAGGRPNIILCMGDDHGWFETGYNGHPFVKTPVLDQMAARGLRLDRFYAAHPNCSPTRGSIMTGRHPNRYGTFAPGWSIRPEEITIAQILRRAGYATGHFGKWHLGPVKAGSPTSPGAMGFDEWVSHDNFYEVDPVFSRNGAAPEKIAGESSAVTVRESIAFLEKARKAGKPSFTVIWFGSPHEPYLGVEPYLSMYADQPEPVRSRLAEITAMDAAIGTLRAHLQKTGMAGNTLLWYCGDNGVPPEGRLTTPLRGAKGDVYEGGVAVPCLLEWPDKIRAGWRSDVNTVTTDILPTLCAVTAQALPDRPLDGVSLLPLFDGKMTERPRPICFWAYEANREMRAGGTPYLTAEQQEGTTPTAKLMAGKYTRDFRNLRHPVVKESDYAGRAAVLDNRYKLVQGKGLELYDVREDRAESTDLAAREHARVESMQRTLREWQSSALRSLTGADYRSSGSALRQ
jgi:arylsulfatase A-like enzyme